MNHSLTIRMARLQDLPRILEIYAIARKFMAENGNPSQWKRGYPWPDMLEEDILNQNLYVIQNGQAICGCFLFIIGDDPTYGYIEDGAWRSDAPYGTIHRIASDGTGGIFAAALRFCRGLCPHIRVDTHHDNKPMQHLAGKHGFHRCGTIYVEDGTPRIAYELLP